MSRKKPMTVAQLIKLLQQFPKDAHVYMPGQPNDFQYRSIGEVWADKYPLKPRKTVVHLEYGHIQQIKVDMRAQRWAYTTNKS